MTKIAVLIVDEHAAIRQALSTRLGSSTQIEIVATTDTVTPDLLAKQRQRPLVVLLGLKSSQSHWPTVLPTIAELHRHRLSVIVLASYADDLAEELLHRAGVSRYLLKTINTPQLIAEIEAVAASITHS